jgi:hypothetical protein
MYVARHAEWHRSEVTNAVIGLYLHEYPDTHYARLWGRSADAQFRADGYRGYVGKAWRLWAGNSSVHRAMFETVGFFDESFRSYGWEDTDWGYRLALAGANVHLDPELETVHRTDSATTAIRAVRAFESGQAHARFIGKHGVDPDVSIDPRTWQNRGWAAAVSLAAVGRQAGFYDVAGRMIDSVVPELPDVIGRRLIGLTIEGAALAGFRHQLRNRSRNGQL